MHKKMKINEDFFLGFMYACYAAVGGLIRHLGEKKREMSFWAFFGSAITSMFTGSISYLMCLHSKLEPNLTGAIVGLSGWIGVPVLYYFSNIFKKYFGNKNTINDNKTEDI